MSRRRGPGRPQAPLEPSPQDVVPPGPPEPRPPSTKKPRGLLPPPPSGWGEERSNDTLERLDREIVLIRRAWIVGVAAAAILAGVVVYALLSPPPARIVPVPAPAPGSAASHQDRAQIDSLQKRVSKLSNELASQKKAAGARVSRLERCFDRAQKIQQHRVDLLIRRRLSAKRYVGLAPPVCSTG